MSSEYDSAMVTVGLVFALLAALLHIYICDGVVAVDLAAHQEGVRYH